MENKRSFENSPRKDKERISTLDFRMPNNFFMMNSDEEEKEDNLSKPKPHKKKLSIISKVKISKSIKNLDKEHLNELYEVLDYLGTSYNGNCYKLKNKSSKALYAMKVFKKDTIFFDLNMLMKTSEILKNISHPNIAKIIDTYTDSENIYQIMEFLEGKTLSESET